MNRVPGAATVVTIFLSAAANAQTPTGQVAQFAVASIKRYQSHGPFDMRFLIDQGGRITAKNVGVDLLLQFAYGVKEDQILGPRWIRSERFEINAKPDDSLSAALQKMTPETRKQRVMLMLRALLAERFALTLHHLSKDLPIYALVLTNTGPKFHGRV